MRPLPIGLLLLFSLLHVSYSALAQNPISPKSNPNNQVIFQRWLPRLNDRSIDLREEAVSRLAAIARSDSAYRDAIVSALIARCRAEETQRIQYRIIDDTAALPLAHDKWLDPFLDLYLEIGNSHYDSIMYHFVFTRLWGLIQNGRVTAYHPRAHHVLELAKKAAQFGDGTVRAVGVKILDLSWPDRTVQNN